MNDQTLRTLDDQDLMDVVGGGGCRDRCEPCFSVEIELEISLCL
jgi:hypothetical protein